MVRKSEPYFVHLTADISEGVGIGKGTQIWHQSQIREGTVIGKECTVGKGVYIDKNSKIGNRVKIQNYASLYCQTIIEDGVFIGPYVCITNDKFPRAVNPDGSRKSENNWIGSKTVIHRGASVGAGAIIIPNIEIGEYAMIGAGSLITKDILPYNLVYGVPSKTIGYVGICGHPASENPAKIPNYTCPICKKGPDKTP